MFRHIIRNYLLRIKKEETENGRASSINHDLEAAIDHALRVERHVFIFIILAIRMYFVASFTLSRCARETCRQSRGNQSLAPFWFHHAQERLHFDRFQIIAFRALAKSVSALF